ncbi:NAD(P)-dependent benzaldehyde dehydrogenase MdlD [Mucilaginibacter lappiensis]|uniref:Aldehyde dehydrogenase n=1 Tax=Mucilaginibacter lappiensis TaxID=354630 RepID=A0A841J6L3_9SPHI|nr:aldehyde dehydrogenase family protein [Mucilaginibacter lappiensis]MBB6126683.1 aldehyde dehydrogenase (NAD+) [Mucilaginibacter lappiensis]
MDTNQKEYITDVFQSQKKFFATRKTQSVDFRIQQLANLKKSFIAHNDAICDAMFTDLGKSRPETEYAEIKLVLDELDYCLENLESWAKPIEMPSKQHATGAEIVSKVTFQPYGVSYIVGPFNYPIQLTFSPLLGAIMGGNTAIIKPSENTPSVAAVIEKIVKDAFPPNYVSVIQGSIEENTLLLSFKFDYIFFTGSPNVGKIVMRAAAEQLIPLTLELGGKSPTIVHKDANLDKAVERIARGKWMNCGQTCVAPDYLYVHESVKEELIQRFKIHLQKTYDGNSLGKIGKIVSQQQVMNLAGYLDAVKEKVVYGGRYDLETRYFEATIMDNIVWQDAVMQQEIFGPILPILTYSDVDTVLDEINSRPKPLALYVFSEDKDFAEDILSKTTSGDAEINSTLIHVGIHFLPFGGVGTSGMGKYHGQYSFQTFSHMRSIVELR